MQRLQWSGYVAITCGVQVFISSLMSTTSHPIRSFLTLQKFCQMSWRKHFTLRGHNSSCSWGSALQTHESCSHGNNTIAAVQHFTAAVFTVLVIQYSSSIKHCVWTAVVWAISWTDQFLNYKVLMLLAEHGESECSRSRADNKQISLASVGGKLMHLVSFLGTATAFRRCCSFFTIFSLSFASSCLACDTNLQFVSCIRC